MKKVVLFITVLLFCLSSQAAENQLTVAKANKAYGDGQYQVAVDLYKQVLQSGYESWDLYYNLGNGFYKLNDFASAILYYEKAKKLNPGSEDIDFNLNVTNNKIPDKIEPLPEIFYKKWIRGIIQFFSVDQWALSVILAFLLSLITAALFVISRRVFLRKAGFWLAIVFLLFAALSFRFAWVNYQTLQNKDSAIIFSPTVTVKSSPDEKSIDLFVLHEGTKVQILDNVGTWYEIKIPNGSVGWLPSSTVEKI